MELYKYDLKAIHSNQTLNLSPTIKELKLVKWEIFKQVKMSKNRGKMYSSLKRIKKARNQLKNEILQEKSKFHY